MNTCFILLWLEAPLQSWGYDSKFSRRDTLDFPTKSGILGLLCCALGFGGEQRNFLAEMGSLKTTVLSYARKEKPDSESIRVPILQDFHMVGAGYDGDKTFELNMIPKKIDGKKATGGGIKLTYRYYLQDKAFAVALEIPLNRSQEFAYALQNPVWDLYLGRKNCAPTDFIYRGIFETEDQTIAEAIQIAEEKSLAFSFKVVDGKEDDQYGERVVLNDVPITFGQRKTYRQRYVTIISEITATATGIYDNK